MKALLLRLLLIAGVVIIAFLVVPGITFENGGSPFKSMIVMVFGLGLVNLMLKQILISVSCGCNVLSLGLFLLVVNTMVVWFCGWADTRLGFELYSVSGFWPAFWAGLIITAGSFFSTMLFSDAQF